MVSIRTMQERVALEELLREAVDLAAGKFPGLTAEDGERNVRDWLASADAPNPYEVEMPLTNAMWNGAEYEQGALAALLEEGVEDGKPF